MRFAFLQFSRRFTHSVRLFSSVRPLIFAASLFIFVSHGAAADNEAGRFTDIRLRAVLQAKSPKELKQINEQSERIKLGRIECEIQLKGRRIPSKCFEVLKNEADSGLLSGSAKQTQEEWLAKLCKKRAQNSNDLRELNRLSDLKFIPDSCREQVISRALDLKYASESEDPSSLFIDRFSRYQVNADLSPIEDVPPQMLPPRPDSGQAAQKLQTTHSVVASRPTTTHEHVDEP